MKKDFTRLKLSVGWLLVSILWLAVSWAGAVEVPELKARINDYANMLSPATKRQLEKTLQGFEAAQSTQIVVLTIPSLKGESIESFSIRTAEAWKIGQKGLDNGAILVIARNDRKLRIEVGYGLEGRLTDLLAGRIIRQIITPAFKTGNFDLGIVNGVHAMMEAVTGEFAVQPIQKPTGRVNGLSGLLIPLIVFVFLIMQLGRITRALGTIAGGIMLPVFGGMFFGGSLIFLLMLIPIGLAAGLFLSLIGSAFHAASGGGRGIFIGGSGRGFGSGFGGGFGGFSGGGGGFGGGGASGGW
jgi:uncharacterized protein